MEVEKSNEHIETLMKSILVERFQDIIKLEALCNQLLEIAEQKHDTYGINFANLYLFDSFLARGDYKQAYVYLLRTQSLCDEYNYRDLSMVFHNLAGLYFQDLFDEHSALHHYLKGLDLAKELNEPITESKVYNNLGLCFRRRCDNEAALYYFNKAYTTIKEHITKDVYGTTISFLCNAAEAYQAMNNYKMSAVTLKKALEIHIDNQYSYLQLKSSWCGHYAVSGNRERSITIAKQLIEDGLCEFNHEPFVVSVYFEVFDHILKIDCKEYAQYYLSLLEANCTQKSIGDYYQYKKRKVKFYECYGTQEECIQAYKEYFEANEKLIEVNNTIHVENGLSKISLSKAMLEIKTIRKENKQLENLSHIDELTQLYNRWHMSKMQANIVIDKNVFIGFVILDVDYFKEYNDFYGHLKGDEALKSVADVLKFYEREGIYASRYGGDEFLVMFKNYKDEEIIDYIMNVQAELHKRAIPHEKSRCSSLLSLSIGCSNARITDKEMIKSLLESADKALYQAKESGRNCYSYHDMTGQSS
ncbi:diguanylate cyclase [Amedibacillus sp. YH-ame10]